MRSLWKLLQRAPITGGMGCAVRFAAEDAGDPGQDGKGDPSQRKGGGGGEKTYDVKVGDETVQMTEKELIEKAGKVEGADRKFREAADLRKKYDGIDPDRASKGQRVLELSEKGEAMSEAEAREFFTLLKIDPSQTGGEKGKQRKEEPISLEKLDPRVQTAIKAAETVEIERIENQISEKIKNAIDKDSVLSKLEKDLPEPVRKGFKQTLYDMGIDDTLDRVYSGQKLGAELLELVVQRLRKRAESLGIPQLLKDRAPVTQRMPGLELLGQGILAEEPIKRVTAGKDDYDTNAVSRLAQRILQGRRKA